MEEDILDRAPGCPSVLLPLLRVRASAASELGLFASLLLAFLLCCPIAAYAAVKCVSPPYLGRTTFAALVIGATALSYLGAVRWLEVEFYYYLVAPLPVLGIPVVSGHDFYDLALRGALGWALAFILPVYLTLLAQFRRTKGLRWHL